MFRFIQWIGLAILVSGATPALAGDAFQPGPEEVRVVDVTPEAGAPAEIRLYLPGDGHQARPLVYFNHGFLVQNQFYSRLLTRIAGHGYVVVSPMMYSRGVLPIGKPSFSEEAALGREILHWAREEAPEQFGYRLDGGRIGLAGHSRGGLIAWMMAAGLPEVAAVAGIDPVDKNGNKKLTDHALAGAASLTIGTGLESSCRPAGSNYVNFYGATHHAHPAWQILAEGYGHMDMLDRSCGLPCSMCSSGTGSADRLIQVAAGGTVALFDEFLKGESSAGFTMELFLQEQEEFRLQRK